MPRKPTHSDMFALQDYAKLLDLTNRRVFEAIRDMRRICTGRKSPLRTPWSRQATPPCPLVPPPPLATLRVIYFGPSGMPNPSREPRDIFNDGYYSMWYPDLTKWKVPRLLGSLPSPDYLAALGAADAYATEIETIAAKYHDDTAEAIAKYLSL